MRSKTPKVLHAVAGRSMVGHVLAAVGSLDPRRVAVVIGHQRELVGPHVSERRPDALLAVQEEQLGTGHAVRVAVDALTAQGPVTGTVVVAYGDTPLLTGDALRAFADEHAASDCAVSVLSGRVPDPTGYGRVLRDADGEVEAIVEEKDATPAQREITEINSGILALDAVFLVEALPLLRDDNAKGEYYLTDVVAVLAAAGYTVGSLVVEDAAELSGVNDRAQLAAAEAELRRRTNARWLAAGVTMVDPSHTYIDTGVELGADVTLFPGTILQGDTVIGAGSEIGPATRLIDCVVGAGATVERTTGRDAEVGERSRVGPYASLAPGSHVAADVVTGPFYAANGSESGGP